MENFNRIVKNNKTILIIENIEFEIDVETITSDYIPHGKHTVNITANCKNSTLNVYTKTVDKTEYDLGLATVKKV